MFEQRARIISSANRLAMARPAQPMRVARSASDLASLLSIVVYNEKSGFLVVKR
jgi:hypothetical protein